MDPGELWSIGEYAIVGDLWSQPERDLAASLDRAGRDSAGRDVAGHAVANLDVIDLATGTGVTAIAIARRGARSVIGVDAAPKLLAEAARRATANGVDVDWIEADVTSVPRPDRSVDLVVSTPPRRYTGGVPAHPLLGLAWLPAAVGR